MGGLGAPSPNLGNFIGDQQNQWRVGRPNAKFLAVNVRHLAPTDLILRQTRWLGGERREERALSSDSEERTFPGATRSRRSSSERRSSHTLSELPEGVSKRHSRVSTSTLSIVMAVLGICSCRLHSHLLPSTRLCPVHSIGVMWSTQDTTRHDTLMDSVLHCWNQKTQAAGGASEVDCRFESRERESTRTYWSSPTRAEASRSSACSTCVRTG